jgi:RimJ/RimL family protein N-acetyltransferase
VLTTQRCRIEPFTRARLSERYVGWLNDPDVVRFSEQRHRRHTLISCEQYANSFADSPHYFWAIIANDDALGHIGNINAYVDEPNGTADVGILIGEKSVWGKGYGAEAWSAVCRFLLADRRLRKVTAGTTANNLGMLGIMKRCGMQEDGRRRKQIVIEGQSVDLVYGAIFRDELASGG